MGMVILAQSKMYPVFNLKLWLLVATSEEAAKTIKKKTISRLIMFLPTFWYLDLEMKICIASKCDNTKILLSSLGV